MRDEGCWVKLIEMMRNHLILGLSSGRQSYFQSNESTITKRIQTKFNKPMCLLGIKDYCPFEIFLPKTTFSYKGIFE